MKYSWELFISWVLVGKLFCCCIISGLFFIQLLSRFSHHFVKIWLSLSNSTISEIIGVIHESIHSSWSFSSNAIIGSSQSWFAIAYFELWTVSTFLAFKSLIAWITSSGSIWIYLRCISYCPFSIIAKSIFDHFSQISLKNLSYQLSHQI